VKANSVDELLACLDLSQEERERHAELIQECLDREKKLILFQRQSEEGLRILADRIQSFGTTLEGVHRSLRQLQEPFGEVFLRRLPGSKLPRA